MKRHVLFLVGVLFSLTLIADDVIILRNGEEISSIVNEITQSEVKYKKVSNPNGPSYTIAKNEVFMIKYDNGEKDLFDDKIRENNSVNGKQTMIAAHPASNNTAVIREHNEPLQIPQNGTKRRTDSFFPVYAVSDSSIMSTDEIEMHIVPKLEPKSIAGRVLIYQSHYVIELVNKTNQIIYVDLASTFRKEGDMLRTYYSTKQTTISNNSTIGIGVGVLAPIAIGVGTSSSQTASDTYSQKQIVSIPPHSKRELCDYVNIPYCRGQYKTIPDLEDFGGQYSLYTKINKSTISKLYEKQVVEYHDTEDNPNVVKYYISYSNSLTFSSFSQLYCKIYLRCIVGGWLDHTVMSERLLGAKDYTYYMKYYFPNASDRLIVGKVGVLVKP